MKQHLLRVERPVVEFESLVAAMRHVGDRAGWLELPQEAAGPLPESLLAAADAGVLRAVAVGDGRSVAVKPLRGAPVLRDLLREHFRGCNLVMILIHGTPPARRGEIDAPLLEPDGECWIIRQGDGSASRWTTEKLIAALRKPRPFKPSIE